MTSAQTRRIRRKKTRRNYLACLAEADLARFNREWKSMLDGWTREIHRRAENLVEPDGSPTPAAFALIQDAIDLLTSCGQKALGQEYEGTLNCLTRACCKAVSKAYFMKTSNHWTASTYSAVLQDHKSQGE